MKKFALRFVAAVFGLLALLFLGLAVPQVDDAPHNLTAKRITLEGHPYMLLKGYPDPTFCYVSFVRFYEIEGNRFCVDTFRVPYLPFLSSGTGNHPPLLMDLDSIIPGRYTVVARRNGRLVEIGSFETQESEPQSPD